MECTECGMKLESWAEYHPYEFCVLFLSGIDPVKFVREAAEHLAPTATAGSDDVNPYLLGGDELARAEVQRSQI